MNERVRLREQDDAAWLAFHCPGCECDHHVQVGGAGAVWIWNGDAERPTLSPSILIRTGHHIPGHTGGCWCTYNAEHPDDPSPFTCSVCHSFVVDGRMQFLGDSTHTLAGRTVDLPVLTPRH